MPLKVTNISSDTVRVEGEIPLSARSLVIDHHRPKAASSGSTNYSSTDPFHPANWIAVCRLCPDPALTLNDSVLDQHLSEPAAYGERQPLSSSDNLPHGGCSGCPLAVTWSVCGEISPRIFRLPIVRLQSAPRDSRAAGIRLPER